MYCSIFCLYGTGKSMMRYGFLRDYSHNRKKTEETYLSCSLQEIHWVTTSECDSAPRIKTTTCGLTHAQLSTKELGGIMAVSIPTWTDTTMRRVALVSVGEVGQDSQWDSLKWSLDQLRKLFHKLTRLNDESLVCAECICESACYLLVLWNYNIMSKQETCNDVLLFIGHLVLL